jgi:hypothetical protein
MIHSGGCHCGGISFTVDAEFTSAIECNCSMCSKRGGLLAFVPRAALVLQSSQNTTQTYRFNQHKLDHHFCSVCGIAPYSEGIGRDGAKMAAINVRCLPDLDLSTLTINQVDGKSF